MIEHLEIRSPKQRQAQDTFNRLYPYYAGFPESFVRDLLSSAWPTSDTLVYDPWNGSGTTTAVASALGLKAVGLDLNPVMVLVAKGRVLPSGEASVLIPLARAILKEANITKARISNDPLENWFTPATASYLRSIERACYTTLIGDKIDPSLNTVSSLAASFYTALFSVVRTLARPFRSANPTWIRMPKAASERLRVRRAQIENMFLDAVEHMSAAITSSPCESFDRVGPKIMLADATVATLPFSADWVITSPPYCTRIDYVASTRVELALISPFIIGDLGDLRKKMIGTTVVPNKILEPDPRWGEECNKFLAAVRSHKSKASSGYYYSTHLDYFDKMFRSIRSISQNLRMNGIAIMILQDSYYKDVYNNVPLYVVEMAENFGIKLRRRVDFRSRVCMSRINTRAIAHNLRVGSTESVLCFEKNH